MANALFLGPYYSDAATVSVGVGTVSGFPATNMQLTNPNKVCRTGGVSGVSILIDFGSAVAATAFALINTNLSSSATWVIGASNSSTSAAAATPSLVAVNGASVWIGSKPTTPGIPFYSAFATWTNTTAYRYWAITLTDGAPATSYFEVGRLMMGVAWQPTLNIDQAIDLGFESTDLAGRGAWNKLIAERRGNVARRLGLQFSTLSETEARSLAAIVLQAGGGGDFFFTIDPADTSNFAQWSGQFYFQQLPSLSSVPIFISTRQAWAVRATISEVL